MKKLKYLSIALLFCAMACDSSSDEKQKQEEKTEGKTDFSTELILSSDKNTIINNGKETAKFKLLNSENNEISPDAKFYANDKELENNTFKSTETGTFRIKAIYEKQESNIIEIKVVDLNSVSKYEIKASRSQLISDNIDEISFKVIDRQTKQEVSIAAEFYADGKAINSQTFKTTKNGHSKLKAKIEKIFTDEVDVYSFPKFAKRMIVEDYTATWCGYCPRLIAEFDKQEHNYSIIPIAIHNQDKMGFGKIGILANEFNVTGYPTGIKDRSGKFYYGYRVPANSESNIGIGLDTKFENNKANINVKVYTKTATNSNLNIVVYLLENNINGTQANNLSKVSSFKDSRFYSLPSHISDFNHCHVLRKSVTDLFGEKIPNKNLKNTTDYEKTFSVDLNTTKAENWDVVAFVVYDKTTEGKKDVLNAQRVKLGESINF
ncbi:MAG: Omp28-related outer membrane protein [Marinifilaceae bacterium]|jgi:uncharacterized protein YcfL|nr:Omp28-related outer membrane protein [Marinifilaceae bacterium]